MGGVYSANGGMGVVRALKLAVNDFGGKVQGKPTHVVSADYQTSCISAAREHAQATLTGGLGVARSGEEAWSRSDALERPREYGP